MRDAGQASEVVSEGRVVPSLEGVSYAGRVRFQILGRLRVADDGDRGGDSGAGLRLGSAKQQLVLALLLAEPNSIIPTDALVERLWGDAPPSTARHTLQGYVSELRKVVGPVIEREGPGYMVRVDSSTLDSLAFEALISQGRARLLTDPAAAAVTLRTALQLWRGAPFSGFDDHVNLLAERTRLEELRLLALEDRVGADLASGRHSEIAAELDALCCEHPYREGLRGQHMLALYRSGRQAEALRAFQRTRAVLVDELGIEPSPQLRRLEEQILVQDSELDLARVARGEPTDTGRPLGNPYKGLQAFTEADVDDFYGRDELIEQLMTRAVCGGGLIVVVGPSGSGKSSLVQAGLIPALRDRDRSEVDWVIASMRPGAYPFTELEAALARVVDDPPAMLTDLLQDGDSGLLRAVLRLLPNDRSRLLLVIDQFEELFTLVDDDQRDRFLSSLITAASDSRGRCPVLVTLRADFYDRPLMHPGFGRLMTGNVLNVIPLAAGDLEAAAVGPAQRRGVSFERGLLASMIAEVSGQPNALPLFQYTLTELFDRRQESTLTLAAYDQIGGLRRAVASRAEEIYQRLDPEQQEAARQLFLRLVTVGGQSETRRVVAASELISLDVDTVTMHAAVEAFVSHRLLVRDRNAFSGALTIEVAHEALLSEWDRLRRWIDDCREELRHHAAYTLLVEDWLTASRDPDYLLTGGRLDHFDQWRDSATMRLTGPEREYLDEALRRRDRAAAADAAAAAEQARLRRRARHRAFALGAALAAITTAAIVAVAGTGNNTAKIAIVVSPDGAESQPGEGYERGLVRAERDFDLNVERRDLGGSSVVAELAANDTDLVFLDRRAARTITAAIVHPDTRYVLTDFKGTTFDGLPNVTSHSWADEQVGFLAGVAAATTTETGIVGFLGAVQDRGQEEYRAGFEAGAQSIDPDIEILAVYLAAQGYEYAPYDSPEGARQVAGLLYDAGTDVIFHAAGRSGVGVFEAAASGLAATKLWAIGVETDQWQTASSRQRPHILTSIVKHFDKQIYTTIQDYLDGSLDPGARQLTVADEMITYSPSGAALGPDAFANLDRTIQHLASGEIEPPRTPKGELTERQSPGTGVAFFNGAEDIPVTFTLPDGWETGDSGVIKGDPFFGLFFMNVGNIYTDSCPSEQVDPPIGPTVDDLASAWANMPGFKPTAPIDVTVDGFDGKLVGFTVPDYGEQDCTYGIRSPQGMLRLLREADGSGVVWAQGPNQHHQLRILDVDGTRLVIGASYFPDTSLQDRAELNEILNSIRIG